MKPSTLKKLLDAKQEYLSDAAQGNTKSLTYYIRHNRLANAKNEYYRQYFDGELTEDEFADLAYPMPMSKKQALQMRLMCLENVIRCAIENNVSLPTEWTVERNRLIETINNA